VHQDNIGKLVVLHGGEDSGGGVSFGAIGVVANVLGVPLNVVALGVSPSTGSALGASGTAKVGLTLTLSIDVDTVSTASVDNLNLEGIEANNGSIGLTSEHAVVATASPEVSTLLAWEKT